MKRCRMLAKRMESAKRLAFLTLTLNPANGTPRELFDYVVKRRLIGEMMRHLRARGLITGWGYFSALEFQNGEKRSGAGATLNAHWHCIVEPAEGVDAAKWGQLEREVQAWWNRHAPAGAPEPVGHTYRMGRCESQDITSDEERERVAWYVATYLAQGSKKGGIPSWYIERADEGHHVRLYSASQGFWTGGVPMPYRKKFQLEEVERPRRRRHTVMDRVMRCCERTSVMRKVTIYRTSDGAVTEVTRKFIGSCQMSIETCHVLFNGPHEHEERALAIRRGSLPVASEDVEELAARGYLVVAPGYLEALGLRRRFKRKEDEELCDTVTDSLGGQWREYCDHLDELGRKHLREANRVATMRGKRSQHIGNNL